MRTLVGLAVGLDDVRAVAVRRGTVTWAAEAPLENGQALADAIGLLLAEAPVRRWPRPVLAAGIGPHASQVRLIAGLPDIEDPETLGAVVREGAGSFFLKNGVPLLVTRVRPASPGTAMAAAIDRPCVEAVREACKRRGWCWARVAPAAIVLPAALDDEHFAWTDGRVVLEVKHSHRQVESVRTRTIESAGLPGDPLHLVPALAALGDQGARYAVAYGAAMLQEQEPLALSPLSEGVRTRADVLRRFILPGVLSLAAIVALLASPFAASAAARRAEARIAKVRSGEWHVIQSTYAQLDRVTAILEEERAFADARSSVTTLLGDVTRALPSGTAVTSFELTNDQAIISILTPDPAVALSAMKRVPAGTSPELVGPAGRDATTGTDLAVVTIRFRTRAPASQGPERRGRP